MTECNPDLDGANLADYPRACEWMRLKYRSLQVFQHMLRQGTHRYPDFLVDERSGTEPVAICATTWRRSSPATPSGRRGTTCASSRWPAGCPVTCDNGAHPCTLLPPVVDQTIHSDPSYTEARLKQSEVFQQTWFVMSFLRDPALLYEGDSFATFIGDYLESVLLPHYDVHHAFIVAKMAVEKSAARGWMEAPGFRAGTGKLASVRTFSFKQLRDNFSPPPADRPPAPGA